MKQIDLDDLPPRLARVLGGLAADEELVLVQGGALIARLRAASVPPPTGAADPPAGEGMAEVMDHFNAMIHDAF